ncbi:hypothetical protein LIER_09940 [Lithospermum erythrorhizon]|uniref:Uncharacterized protein n=1 Tax=Lithospermum erythrorhizon TaxID=34254 RepID=A0AAV3PLS7_LITER
MCVRLLDADATRSINKLVFVIFAPALIFANIVETVTLKDIISCIGLTFFFEGILGGSFVGGAAAAAAPASGGGAAVEAPKEEKKEEKKEESDEDEDLGFSLFD